jgi:hypothetical protein
MKNSYLSLFGVLESERVLSFGGCASHKLERGIWRALVVSVALVTLFVGEPTFIGGPTDGELIFDAVPSAEAANYRIRSITIGRATQYFRSDGTVSAPRVLTQGLSVWGYDLLDDRTGSVNLHLSLRYNTDFSLVRRERDNPYFNDQWNELTLDLAYLDWHPYEAMRLRLGRQWSQGALGIRDFDGLLFEWRPRVEAGTHARFEVYTGRDIQTAFGEFDAATFDVQGLPPDSGMDDPFEADKLDGVHLIGGASAGMQWGAEAGFELSYRRRWSLGVDSPLLDDQTVVGSERFGAAASAAFHPRLVASAHGSIHSQLGDVDRAATQLTWRVPGATGYLSGGVEHRHPWFDSSSIFNLFGARPHQSAFGLYQLPVESLRTEFEVRGWGRQYHGDEAAVSTGVAPQDERALGGAISHTSRLSLWEKPMSWRTLLSYQASVDRGTDQLLADSRVRMPVLERALFVSARGLVLMAMTNHQRFDDQGYAATGVLGLDVPVSTLGTLSVAVETTGGSFYPTNTSVYAIFAVEHWP